VKSELRIYGARGSCPAIGDGYKIYGGHTACMAAFLPQSVVVLDGGTGLMSLGSDLSDLSDQKACPINIFLTHLHYDHILGLPFFPPVYQKGRQITVYLPENMAVFLQSLWGRPYFPVSLQKLPAHVRLKELSGSGCVELEAGFCMHYLQMHSNAHEDGVMIYRLCSPERQVAYVSDVELSSDEVMAATASFVSGADVLLCDAQYLPGADYEEHRGWGHNNTQMAQELARKAGVGQLLLIHHEPGRDDAALAAVAAQVANWQPPTQVAAINTRISL
jgi:ribonuclease BN (tRNA processing enzyme)